MKKAFLAGARFGRRMLKPFKDLTPARFDMMLALYTKSMRQRDLWRLLGVVRSAVSELLEVLTSLGWVKRIRAADGRTKLVSLTVRGRVIFERAYAWCIRSGEATLEMNCALKGSRGLADPEKERAGIVTVASSIVEYFGWILPGAEHLYFWDPADIFELMDWPIGDNAHYELLVADEGTIIAPMFEAGDVLAEIEDQPPSGASVAASLEASWTLASEPASVTPASEG